MISFKNISIIIPVGPDEELIDKLLGDLEQVKSEAEIISIKGSHRAKQLNEGALKATRDFLWFLHADSRLDEKAFEVLLTSINNAPDALHYFRLRFLNDGPRLVKINEIGCLMRSRILGIPFGDQGFCVAKKIFKMIGKFPEDVPYGEDHSFVWQAKRKGIKLKYTGACIRTSARAYAKAGWARLTWKYVTLTLRQSLAQMEKET